jgi:hypothetical protein
MSSANMVLGRSSYLQLPLRALLYGLAVWFIWTTLVITAFELLPEEIATSALFVSMKVVSLAALVLAVAVLYLRRVAESTLREGLVVGLGWTVLFIASDLIHYSLMHSIDVGNYFLTVVPSYIVMPVTTTLVMGYLKPKS